MKKTRKTPTYHQCEFVIAVSFFALMALITVVMGVLSYSAAEDVLVAQAQTVVLPKEHLKNLSELYNLDYELLNRIIWCESNWRMVGNSKSTAFGFFQILDRIERSTPQYVQGKSKFNPLENIEMGVYLFRKYGVQPWLESRKCWQYYY